MSSSEIISLTVTLIGVFSFAALFTILYRTYAISQINEIVQGKRDIEIIDEVIYEKQIAVRRRRKIFKVVKTILYYLCLLIVVPLFLLSVVSKIQDNTLMIGNKAMMVVASPSMSYKNESNDYLVTNNLNDQFETYDILILEKVENYSDLNQYDIIAFKNDKGINIIHRIKEFKVENGLKVMVTRGDANNGDDEYKPVFDDVIGRVTSTRIKGLGMFIMFLQSYAGIITIVSLIYCLLMIDFYSTKIEKTQKNRVNKLEEAIDYSSETSADSLKAKYHETIYYKGYEYSFDENGLIEKKEVKNVPHEKDDVLVKEVVNENNEVVTTKKIEINNEREKK